METKQALIESIKYTLLSTIPTALGLTLVVVGVWGGLLGELMTLVSEGGIEELLSGDIGEQLSVNWWILAGGIGSGYLVHRIGRTALLFKLSGDAIRSELGGPEPGAGSESAPAERATATSQPSEEPAEPAGGETDADDEVDDTATSEDNEADSDSNAASDSAGVSNATKN